jgi:hypothetical protein
MSPFVSDGKPGREGSLWVPMNGSGNRHSAQTPSVHRFPVSPVNGYGYASDIDGRYIEHGIGVYLSYVVTRVHGHCPTTSASRTQHTPSPEHR